MNRMKRNKRQRPSAYKLSAGEIALSSTTSPTRLDDLFERDHTARWKIYSFAIIAMAAVGLVADLKGIPLKSAALLAVGVGVISLIWRTSVYISAPSEKAQEAMGWRLWDILRPSSLAYAAAVVFVIASAFSPNARFVRPSLAVLVGSDPNKINSSDGNKAVILPGTLNLDLLTERIRSAKTSEELSSSLKILTNTLHLQSEIGEKVGSTAQQRIGGSIYDATQKYPDTPDVWKAASSFVNYRANSLVGAIPSSLPSCWDMMKGHWEEPDHPLPPGKVWIDDQVMGHCSLSLDDGPQFRDSKFGKAYEHNLTVRNQVQLRLNVHDAVVTYNGGKLIPFAVLNCLDCTFRVDTSARPPPAGQKVMEKLLIANLNNVKLLGESG